MTFEVDPNWENGFKRKFDEAIEALQELYEFGDAVGKDRRRKEDAYIAAAAVLRRARGEL